jgi:hypothetical protein
MLRNKIVLQQHGYLVTLMISVLLCTIIGCETLNENEVETISEDEQIKNEIEILVELLGSPSFKLGEICRRLIEFGPRAIPELSRNIESHNQFIRTWCLYCLGPIYVRTKSSSIKALHAKIVYRLRDQLTDVRMEAAYLLCQLQDYQGVPILIQALRHPKPYLRKSAMEALEDIFQVSFGNDYINSALYDKTAESWEQWWSQNRHRYESTS